MDGERDKRKEMYMDRHRKTAKRRTYILEGDRNRQTEGNTDRKINKQMYI